MKLTTFQKGLYFDLKVNDDGGFGKPPYCSILSPMQMGETQKGCYLD